MTKSLPGMCGKPRKFTTLSKRSRHVSNRLSQPAVTLNASPPATGSGIACHSTNVATPSVTRWLFTSTARPAFAPPVHVLFTGRHFPALFASTGARFEELPLLGFERLPVCSGQVVDPSRQQLSLVQCLGQLGQCRD